MRQPVALALCLALLGCRGPTTRPHDPDPLPDPKCGDGTVDATEDCDGSNLAEQSCQTLGFDTGQLTCGDNCRFATSLCTKKCGNGVLDPGEDCDGALGLQPCADWGYPACSSTCQLDQRHCVSQAFEAGPALTMAKGGAAIIGDVSPRGPGDLVMVVPSYFRVEALPWVANQGFDAVTGRKLSYQRSPVLAEVCDANGDGNQDVVTINADGTVDQLLFTGAGFSLQALDGGCVGGTFLGRGAFGRGAGTSDQVVVGCGGLLVVGNGSLRRLDAPDAGAFALGDLSGDGLSDVLAVRADSAQVLLAPSWDAGATLSMPVAVTSAALGDLDADGDLDLAAVVGQDVKLLENVGGGFAERVTFTSAGPGWLRVADVDLDGRTDVTWASGDELLVRRNRGAWLFSELRVGGGTGPRLSVALGDADGDGDADFAVTVSTGGDSTRTTVQLNRVR